MFNKTFFIHRFLRGILLVIFSAQIVEKVSCELCPSKMVKFEFMLTPFKKNTNVVNDILVIYVTYDV